ncbi:hypothetical protein QBC40DRAFT_276743 [Triangularia verruculosa]|uniref:Uncharacterized protein n=1 Tax=Triangularia verruculosa TaxID=2587418 RepID=A0AAN7AX60_9PEZI|nr:hypothetical protein QBC40DRAFT_276743 [Triangularia verruculosa]
MADQHRTAISPAPSSTQQSPSTSYQDPDSHESATIQDVGDVETATHHPTKEPRELEEDAHLGKGGRALFRALDGFLERFGPIQDRTFARFTTTSARVLSTILMVALTIFAAYLANEGVRLARWTAEREFLDYCETHEWKTIDCQHESDTTLEPPPRVRRYHEGPPRSSSIMLGLESTSYSEFRDSVVDWLLWMMLCCSCGMLLSRVADFGGFWLRLFAICHGFIWPFCGYYGQSISTTRNLGISVLLVVASNCISRFSLVNAGWRYRMRFFSWYLTFLHSLVQVSYGFQRLRAGVGLERGDGNALIYNIGIAGRG